MPAPTSLPDPVPHHAYGASVVRALAWRMAWPMALVATVLFGLLWWETTRLLPPSSPALAAALWRTGMLLAVALLLVVGAGWVLARRAVRPVAQLTAAIERLGRGEQVRLPVDRGEVMGRLQRGVNEASLALARARNRMQTELGRASVELADRNARLEAASQARARFLAAASHDLRQPLYALTLFSSALRAGETDPVKLARVSRIEECVGSLDQLFSELLDLSRLEAGAMSAAIAPVRLDEVFDEVSRNFRLLAETRGLRLVVRKTEAWVATDRTMLARILNNLVSNALRYTEAGGVLVGVRHRRDGQVQVEVWDTGRGIAPEHQRQVFEEFYQVADARHDAHGERRRGLGLGLSTVRRLAGLLDCRLDLASRPARGTRVSLLLPPALPAHGARAEGEAEMPLDVSGLRVLVVDDEPGILDGLCALLGEWGCSVLAAAGKEAALAQLAAWPQPPDLVVTDLHLGEGCNGIDVLHAVALRYGHDPQRPGFARLLVTGETRRERIGAVAASRVPVLFKPVSPQRLREAMLASVFVARADPQEPA